MDKLHVAILVVVVGWMLNAMAATQAYGNRNTAEVDEPGIQDTVSGVDTHYKHGHWCVDSRSF